MLHQEIPLPFVCRFYISENWRASLELLADPILDIPVGWFASIKLWDEWPIRFLVPAGTMVLPRFHYATYFGTRRCVAYRSDIAMP